MNFKDLYARENELFKNIELKVLGTSRMMPVQRMKRDESLYLTCMKRIVKNQSVSRLVFSHFQELCHKNLVS